MYQVQYSPRAVRDLENLPQKVARRIATKADALGYNPRPLGVLKMEGEANLYRIRVGNYRIIYQIRDNALVVLVVTIGDRKDVYR